MTKQGKILNESGQNNELQDINSCNCGGRYQNHQESDPFSKTVFQCPLKCEGNKTYNVPGNCPVCNRHLEQVTEVHQQYYL